MKFLDPYRNAGITHALAKEIAERTTKPWGWMEICGGQAHTIMRYGLDELLPKPDPLYVVNKGKLVAIVAPEAADVLLLTSAGIRLRLKQ